MWSVGIDAHHRFYVTCILDESGRVVKEFQVRGAPDDLVSMLASLDHPFRVAFEASTEYGLLHDLLREVAEEVIVAHPGQLRLIFKGKRKNDRIDAGKVAKLLHLDEIPRVHVPELPVREWRGLIEHRTRFIHERTRAKNALRALLRVHSMQAPRGQKLWTKAGREWLRSLEFSSTLSAFRRTQLLREVESYDEMIAEVTQELDRLAAGDPRIELLRTIPGVGPRTAEAFLAYVDQPERFARGAQVAAYFGLVPCLDESAGASRYGRITREGPATVRRLLTEASWHAKRLSPSLNALYERVRAGRKDRTAKAVIAVARHLTEVMLVMLKTNGVWEERLAA
jgi:transposase